MIWMSVRDQDEIGWLQTGNIARLGGIDVDGIAAGSDHRERMVNGRDFYGAGGGSEYLNGNGRSHDCACRCHSRRKCDQFGSHKDAFR
jgi:hypothetical protein